ncbi:phosphate ABC transporter membrane protein 1 (PhoT family) [Tenacibaculum adriaticum]|uniref:Phosphate transport system permease protein n=1 Tax=Tenacibaculum adriaticum TaxID=413713 RepID=A0A5S5DTF4_9FLAO|nr:phosphate ABC transporter permease subunit PstC [Tenacibaculum adriaticum]TYP98964.1 phosphate ABC transporter membrane protein 1 (PhoT family) [Tenacibaculum adriaticum]
MNRNRVDSIFIILFRISGFLAVIILFGIFFMLVFNGIWAFKEVSLTEFFTSSSWSPSAYDKPEYGILSMVASSILVTFLAMLIAVPIGVGAAAYLVEFASTKVASILKPAIEMLAAIPSVTIGFLGIVLVGPFLAKLFGSSNGLNALNGAILLAVMALPTIISISEDAMYAVPKTYKEASLALGANRWETLVKVIIPSGSSGIIAAIMLGMGRVIGETMAVLMATGNALAMPKGIFSSVQPLTATIAIEMGEVPYNTIHYYSLFALGVILFLITLVINVLADIITQRFKVK